MENKTKFKILERITSEPNARWLDIYDIQNTVVASIWQQPETDPDVQHCHYIPNNDNISRREALALVEKFYSEMDD